jgi:hypothetical protein
MAQRKNPSRQRRAPRRRKASRFSLESLFRRKSAQFKPDVMGSDWISQFHITRVQRDIFLKWGSYIGICLLLCMIQDVIMSQVRIMGATTDLVVSAILLITVMEGVETGSMFVILSSLIYYFTGSAPSPWCVLTLTYLGIGASIFRQMYLHRGLLSITFCAGVALMIYEVITYGIALFLGLTYWGRIFHFVVTGAMSWAFMLALYPLIHKLGMIGGNTWKE